MSVLSAGASVLPTPMQLFSLIGDNCNFEDVTVIRPVISTLPNLAYSLIGRLPLPCVTVSVSVGRLSSTLRVRQPASVNLAMDSKLRSRVLTKLRARDV
jgi:hypothetical protein